MGYLIGLAALGLLFAVLHFFTELSHKQKSGVVAVLALLIGAMYLYNVRSDAQRAQAVAVVLKYHQGKTLTCKGIEVNQSTFSYSIGTQTFIGREGSVHNALLISVTECR
ncbi:MAG: hypothetical protein JXK05_02570 [Campylobacterales bacterium]|nr:hypothetical protein [Campylobacterales bacterium]